MALQKTLIGLGVPASVAKHTGDDMVSLTAVGTTQVGALALGDSTWVLLTTSGGNTACILNVNAPIGWSVVIYCNTATTALVYPDVGGTIDNGSANASISVAQNVGRRFKKVASLTWVSGPDV